MIVISQVGSMPEEDKKASILDNKWILLAIVFAIIVLNVYLRSPLLQFQGLFEPDGFLYYTAIQQAVSHGFIESNPVLLSGYPWHYSFGEDPMLIYATTIPYAILQYTGMSLLDVMRWVPVFFGVIEALAAYFLVRYLADSRFLGLLAMFFVSANSGNIARTAATVYRGDTFVSFFIIIALILMLKVITVKDRKRALWYTLAAGFMVSSGILIWTGGFIIPFLFFACTLPVIMFAFVIGDKEDLYRCMLLDAALLIGYVLNLVYLAAWPGIVHPTILTTPSFLAFLLPTVIGTFLAYWIVRERENGPAIIKAIANSLWTRTAFLLAAIAVIIIIVLATSGSYVHLLATNGNSIYGSGNIYSTTQELQSPFSPAERGFLWDSFGFQLVLAPIGAILFLFLAHLHGNTKHIKKGKITLNMYYSFVVIFSYLFWMAYLQFGAIRYNSMFSIPLALFSAYAIYLGVRLFSNWRLNVAGTLVPVNAIYAGFIFAILAMQVGMTYSQSATSGQADGINPYFLQAMSWMANNTAANSKVLALWPDGSVVEGWAHRQSYMDSVTGENSSRIAPFAQYILNVTPDTQYLTTDGPGGAWHPDYIVARYFWNDEIGGIAVEGNITKNLTDYGFSQLTSMTNSKVNNTIVYQFNNSNYVAQLRITPQSNGTTQTLALLGAVGSNKLALMRKLIFLNQSSLAYEVINLPVNRSVNYSLLVTYSGSSITGAEVLGQKLPYTNMFKMLYECSFTSCALGSGNVTAQLVYANADTKIIHLTYT